MDRHFEINEEERPHAPSVDDVTLQGIAKTVAHHELRVQEEAVTQIVAQQHAFYDRLVDGAYHLFSLEKTLQQAKKVLIARGGDSSLLRGVESSKNRLVRWLAENGVEIENPTGRILDDELLQLVEVEDWSAPGDVKQDMVKETMQPVIHVCNGQIRPGRVIGVPGNPSQSSPPEVGRT